jgi:nitrogen regulatory protein P-II 2
MNLVSLKLITIIVEDELEDRIVRELKDLGATGYTVCKARGEGTHRARISEWEGENVRIETIVSDAVAEKIIAQLAGRYFDKYGVVVYVSTVEVLRAAKFIPDQVKDAK